MLALFFFASNAAFAGVQDYVPADVVAPLGAPIRSGAEVRLEKFAIDGRPETLVLEEFSVLAEGAEIIVWGDGSEKKRVAPQPLRQFRGRVEGDPESLVYLSTSSARGVDGVIIRGERKFYAKTRTNAKGQKDLFVGEISASDEMNLSGQDFVCGVDGERVRPTRAMVPASLAFDAAPRDETLLVSPTATATYNLVISTDSALYTRLGSSAPNVETYVRNLLGAASTIYQRDLDVDLRIGALDIRTTTDPWNINPGTSGSWTSNGTTSTVTYSTIHALLEYGDYWHNSPPSAVRKSAAMLLSGQSQTSGVAWMDAICEGEFFCNPAHGWGSPYASHYGGAYAYCGGVAGTGDTGIPNVDVNPGNSGYWSLLQVAHELGHIVQSPHTHCTTLTPARQTSYGRTFVDNCYNSEVASPGDPPCFGGSTSIPAEKGTIMSYCHMSGGSQTRWTFGKTGEASEQILENMRNVADLKDEWGNSYGIVPKTPNLSVITLSSTTMSPGGTGTASIVPQAGFEYIWSVTNGTLNSGQGTNSIGFTATAHPVTVKITVLNASGCGATDSVNVTVNVATIAPPANVVAAATGATSIGISWSASTGAASYQIWRRTGNTWAQVGTSPTTSYTDTVSAGTAYLYRVRAVDGSSNASTDSNFDLATAIAYTDPSVVANTTAVKAAHFTELRTAVNAVRALAGLGAAVFTDPALSSSITVKGAHVTELRTGLDAARSALGLTPAAYTDASPSGVAIKAAHIAQLRAGVL